MSDCPPPPPPPVHAPADAPTVTLPLPTAQWFQARDVYAGRTLACYLDARATLTTTTAARDAAEWEAEALSRHVAQLERRPGWGAVAVAGGAGVVVGVVAVGVVAVSLR